MLKNTVFFIEKNFFILIIIVAILAITHPQLFLWANPFIPKFLGIVMFGMGILLKFSDFNSVWKNKKLVLVGILLQYTIMPILAVIISKLLHLPLELMVGVVLVGCCPSGTASNVMTYLAKGDLALSVILTLSVTMLAPIVTPSIIYFILSKKIAVSFISMVKSIFWIVFFPIMDGLIIRRFLNKKLENFLYIFPTISMLFIAIIIGAVIASNQKLLSEFSILVFIAVFLHNSCGFILGYFSSKLFSKNKATNRTLSIEVGMQNSGLAVSLAMQFFTPVSALVGAIFSIWQNLAGIFLANFWAAKNKNNIKPLA